MLVDPYFEGAITNTVVITHPSLKHDVNLAVTSYVTNDPVLQITKTASPDPVHIGTELVYTLRVTNLGQQATELVVTDTIPLTDELRSIGKIRQLSVAEMLAETIRRIAVGESVSSLYVD